MPVDWVVVGVDNGATTNNGTVLDSRGQFLLDQMAEVPSNVREGPGKAIQCLVDSVEQVLELTGVPVTSVRAVGLDTPGPASADGVISSRGATNFGEAGWGGFDIRSALAERLGLPVIYNNDGNAAALYAHHVRFGRDSWRHSSVSAIVGTGLGGGLIEAGRVIKGAAGMAGELGHVPIPMQGLLAPGQPIPSCNCGQRGDAESVASLTGIQNNLLPYWLTKYEGHELAGLPPGMAAKLVRRYGEHGDAMALRIFRQQAIALGRLFTIAANFFDPAEYFLGGGVVEAAPRFRDWFLAEVRAHTVLREEQARAAGISLVPDLDMAGARGSAIAARDWLVGQELGVQAVESLSLGRRDDYHHGERKPAVVTILALGAAILYGTADFLGGMASRRASVFTVLALTVPTGAVVMVAAALLGGTPWVSGLLGHGGLGAPTSIGDWSAVGWAAISGVCGAAGLIAFYAGFAAAPLSVVAPVAALVSALLPVGVAVAEGERPRPGVIAGGLLCLIAIVLVSTQPAQQPEHRGQEQPGERRRRASSRLLALGYGAAAGAGFGLFFLFLKEAGQSGVLWPVAISRLAGTVVALGIALVAGIRPWRQRGVGVAGIAVVSGTLDAAANVCYVLATRAGLFGLAVVITSLYPGMTVLLARFVLGERMRWLQRAGLLLAAVGVVLVTA